MDSNREDLQRSLSSRTLLSIRPIAGQSLQSRQYAPQNRYPENYLISLIRFIWVNEYGSHAGYAIGMLRFEIQSRAYCWPIDDWRSRTDSSSWSLLRARMFLAPGQSLSYSSWVLKLSIEELRQEVEVHSVNCWLNAVDLLLRKVRTTRSMYYRRWSLFHRYLWPIIVTEKVGILKPYPGGLGLILAFEDRFFETKSLESKLWVKVGKVQLLIDREKIANCAQVKVQLDYPYFDRKKISTLRLLRFCWVLNQDSWWRFF